MTPRLPLLFLAAISLPLSALPAQGAGKPGTGIVLRLLACEVTKELPKVFLETEDSKSDAFDLPSSAFTAPMPVSGREVALKAAGSDAPLSNIKLPGEGDSFAVMLAPQEPSGFVPTAVRLDDAAFKPGDYYFINCSGKTVVLKLGGTDVVVETGGAVKSHPTEPVQNRYYNITMSVRDDAGDKMFASTRWPMENPKRGYVIFTARPNGKITYRAVDG